MSKILVSSCLLGDIVRYDGAIKPIDPKLLKLQKRGVIVPVCPEVAGGLPVPRPPAEITNGDGYDVLKGDSEICRQDGSCVTEAFLTGAAYALDVAKKESIKIAILKSKSPSCSNKFVYDGTFSGKLKAGTGVTAALLMQHGIRVYSEDEIDEAIAHFEAL